MEALNTLLVSIWLVIVWIYMNTIHKMVKVIWNALSTFFSFIHYHGEFFYSIGTGIIISIIIVLLLENTTSDGSCLAKEIQEKDFPHVICTQTQDGEPTNNIRIYKSGEYSIQDTAEKGWQIWWTDKPKSKNTTFNLTKCDLIRPKNGESIESENPNPVFTKKTVSFDGEADDFDDDFKEEK